MGKNIRVAGFDPSFTNWGFFVADVDVDSGAVTPVDLELVETQGDKSKQVRKNSDDLRRANELRSKVFEKCEGVQVAISEIPQGTQSARSAWALGITIGVLASCPVPLIQVNPNEVKLATVGDKQASKQAMIDWAVGQHPQASWLYRTYKGERQLVAKNEHLADAVAVVHTGIQTEQFGLLRSVAV